MSHRTIPFSLVTREKEEGSAVVPRFLVLIITVVVVSMLAVQFVGYIKVMDIKDEISLTMRKYIIRMETTGYLADDDKKSMLEELNEIGVTGVDFSGTTMHEVEYGNIIDLHITGKLKVKTYNFLAVFKGEWKNEVINIDEISSSTSQN